MFAQSLGEYGGSASLVSGVQQLAYSTVNWLGSLSATTWIVVAVVVIGLAFLLRR